MFYVLMVYVIFIQKKADPDEPAYGLLRKYEVLIEP